MANRTPRMLRIMALIWSGLCFGAFMFIFRRKLNKNDPTKTLTTPINNSLIKSYERLTSMKDCLRSKKLYEYFFLLLVTNYFNSFFMNSFKSFASYSNSPISDYTLTLASSCGTISNACFRIIFGRMSDKVGFRPLYVVLMLL